MLNPTVKRDCAYSAAPTFDVRHMRILKPIALGFACFGVCVVHAKECSQPPISSEAQAVCLSEEYVEKMEYKWPVSYKVKEESNHWAVHYHPTSSHIRGGAGDLRVEKASGNVSQIKGYK